MKNSNTPSKGNPSTDSLDTIVQFLEAQNSFQFSMTNMDISIMQLEDKKNLRFNLEKIEKVLERVDYDGASGKVSITFHPSGIKTLADELASQNTEDAA